VQHLIVKCAEIKAGSLLKHVFSQSIRSGSQRQVGKLNNTQTFKLGEVLPKVLDILVFAPG